MIGKVKRHASRVGLQQTKFLFCINVTQLIIAHDAPIPPAGSVLNICFEKGGKISASNEIVFDMNKNDVNPLHKQANLKYATIPVDEKLELVVTLYRDTSGLIQAKKGKIILRQLKRNPGLGMDAFKVIGIHMLDLHTLAQAVGKDRVHTQEVTMEPIKGCTLKATITTKIILKRPSMFGMRNSIGRLSTTQFGNIDAHEGGDSDQDDNMSVGSIVSDGSVFSTLGATFYYEDLEEYSGKGDGIVGSQGTAVSDLHYGSSPERNGSNRSGKQRNYPNNHQEYDYDSAENTDGMSSVGGARRRRSGLHVMEVAMHGADKRPMKPLSRRPSMQPSGGGSGKLSAGTSGKQGTDADETAEDPPVDRQHLTDGRGQTPQDHDQDQQRAASPSPTTGAHTGASPLSINLHTPAARIRASMSRSRDCESEGEGDDVGEDVEDLDGAEGAGAADEEGWEALPSSARSKGSHASSSRSPYGSPFLSGRKKRSASGGHAPSAPSHSSHSSPAHYPHQNHKHPALHGQHPHAHDDSAAPAHQPYDHNETFALYTRELQVREERIALLEGKLSQAEEAHRAEVLALRSQLHSTQAELRLQQQLNPLPVPVPAPVPGPVPAVQPVQVSVQTQEDAGSTQCARCGCETTLINEESEESAEVAQATDDAATASALPMETAPHETQVELAAVEVDVEMADCDALESPVGADSPQRSTTAERSSPNVRVTRYNNSNGTTASEPAPALTSLSQPAPSSHVVTTAVPDASTNSSPLTELTRACVDGTTATAAQVAALFNITMAEVTNSLATGTDESAVPSSSANVLPANPPGFVAGSAAASAVSALLSEYGRTSAQVQMLAQDLLYYKQLAEEALQAKADETLASREAATVAVQACMRRADCEQELADAMQQLLELQRRYARLSLQCESEQRRNYGLKSRLQVYAQKLSALEVNYSLSVHQTEELEDVTVEE